MSIAAALPIVEEAGAAVAGSGAEGATSPSLLGRTGNFFSGAFSGSPEGMPDYHHHLASAVGKPSALSDVGSIARSTATPGAI